MFRLANGEAASMLNICHLDLVWLRILHCAMAYRDSVLVLGRVLYSHR